MQIRMLARHIGLAKQRLSLWPDLCVNKQWCINNFCVQSVNNGHMTVFPQACTYLCSQFLMLTFQYLLWPSCSIQSLVLPKGLFVDRNLQSEGLVPCEWAHNHGANLQSVSERLLWFCVLWRFTTFSLSVLLFLRLLDIVRHLHS